MHSKQYTLLAVLAALVLVLSACSAGNTAAPKPTAPAVNPATSVPAVPATSVPAVPATGATRPAPTPAASSSGSPAADLTALSGDIIAAGSSTVYPLAERMAERFSQEGFPGRITIDSIGSGAGFERFCKSGETDISNASRKIKDSEVENCKAIGRTPLEFRVGTDAIAVVVSTDNTFLTGLTTEQLANVFSGKAAKWSDVDPSYPAEDIQRFSPGTDSGTFDFFVEAVLQPAYNKDNAAAKNALLNAPNIQFSEDDNVLVQGVEGSPYAIGYFGYAYFNENQGKLKAISLNDITPSLDTAEDGSYPLSRPLFIYSDAKVMAEKPQVAAFIDFFLTHVNDEIQDVGYFPASSAALDAARKVLQDAVQ